MDNRGQGTLALWIVECGFRNAEYRGSGNVTKFAGYSLGWIKKKSKSLLKTRSSSRASTITVIGGVNVAHLPPAA